MKVELTMNNILFFTLYMSVGGAEKVIANLVNSYVKKGIDCTIVTLIKSECIYNIDARVNIVSLSESKYLKRSNYIHLFKKLRKLVKRLNPDIIVGMPEEVIIKAIPFLLGLDIPIVVSERNNPYVMPKSKITRVMRRIFYPFVDGFIFQTEGAANFFSKSIKKRSKIIQNPLDADRLPPIYEGERKKEVIHIGRFQPQKNHELLIRAFSDFYKLHSDYKLIMYGNGESRQKLEELASKLLPKEAYSFNSARNDVWNVVNSASMFVLSSDYEGLPNVLIEAMALSIPVISTDCPSGGPRSLITNKENGILVSVNNKEELSNAMCRLAENPKFAAELGKNSMKIRDQLELEKITEQWRCFLNDIYKKGHRT